MKKLISLILAALLALSTLTAGFAATYTDKDTVKKVQQALNDAGYNCGRPDGSFGGRTASAVSGFEAANGIEPDGIAWPGVLKLLGMPVPEIGAHV